LNCRALIAGFAAALLAACASTPTAEPESEPAPAAEHTMAPEPTSAVEQTRAPSAPRAAPTAKSAAPSVAADTAFDGGRATLKPRAPIATIDRTVPPQDLWQRIRQGFSIPDIDNALVREKMAYYAARPEYLQRIFDRSRMYLYHIVDELEKRGMPT